MRACPPSTRARSARLQRRSQEPRAGQRAVTRTRAKVGKKPRAARPRQVDRISHVRWRGCTVSAMARQCWLSVHLLPLLLLASWRAAGSRQELFSRLASLTIGGAHGCEGTVLMPAAAARRESSYSEGTSKGPRAAFQREVPACDIPSEFSTYRHVPNLRGGGLKFW